MLKQNYQHQVDKWIAIIFHYKSWPFNFLHIIFRFVALMEPKDSWVAKWQRSGMKFSTTSMKKLKYWCTVEMGHQ
jgi:hypothetical protein